MASPCVQFSVALKLRAASTRGESTASRSGVERGSTGGRRTRIVVRAASSIPDGVSMTRNGKKRVVITGLGVVTAHGNDVDDFYAKLLAGESAISPITEWTPHTDQGTVIAGEIKGFDPEEFMTKKMARRVDPFIAYQIVAAKKALQSAGIPFAKGEEMDAMVDKTRAGCLIGSAMGGLHSFTAATENCVKEFNGENPSWIGHKKMNPFCIPFAITNMGSALTAMDLGFMGPNYSISSACASGNFCILNSVDHIRNGEADLMLAGASDAAVLPSGMGGFSAVKALSKRNDDPTAASRPWDKGRDGFVMGEGAGVLVLESLEHALGRVSFFWLFWLFLLFLVILVIVRTGNWTETSCFLSTGCCSHRGGAGRVLQLRRAPHDGAPPGRRGRGARDHPRAEGLRRGREGCQLRERARNVHARRGHG